MESSTLEQDKAADVPANVKAVFDEMFKQPATAFEKATTPSELDAITKAGNLIIDCHTQCPPAQSIFYIGTVWNNGVQNTWGPFKAPYRAVIAGGCGGARTVGFVCGNATTGPLAVDVCYASVVVCRCA